MIDTNQMEAILNCIKFIRARHQNDNLLFMPQSEHPNIKTLIKMIKDGSADINEFLSSSCTVRECTSALFSFLRSFDEGLLPIRAQQLIKSHNRNIPLKTIALDTLGCIIDELRNEKQINFIITIELLKLMKLLSTEGSLKPTEILCSQGPYFLMPILFDKNVRK
ncbi:hypothetical protein PVAND_004769 [Polypedilum vanderplanki]|uniref:Uncharacterized protein n=1 Tax=Polypedilum vanderplanki TaxID=319348 RepID=A0A9J6C034_POLVA|nr:hypothetical protein PVAND_004769 [Polypedilum vanderplanki]